ncbi:MAG: hypothetical protein IPK19_39485 [Chloroflexi bacterium]|nr:hypothetical protein [Chloroflexota bacterium]
MDLQPQPGCFERLGEIISAILLLFAGVTGGGSGPGATALEQTMLYTLRPVVAEYTEADLEQSAVIIEHRLEAWNAQVTVQGDVLEVRVPQVANLDTMAMTTRGELEFVDVDGSDQSIGSTSEILSAKAQLDQFGQWIVFITLTPEGGEIMSAFTRDHIGDTLAIVMDGMTFSEPVVNSEIGAEVVVSGNFTKEAAESIAELLARFADVGALPFAFTIDSVDVE